MMMDNRETLDLFSFMWADSQFTNLRFDYSTADIEASIFFGNSSIELPNNLYEDADIKGVFKLIDGRLCEIVNSAPPNSTPIERTSGLFQLANSDQ